MTACGYKMIAGLSPSSATSSESQLPAIQKLKRVSIMVRAIIRLKNNVPRAVEDVDELIESVENSPVLLRSPYRKSVTGTAVESHKLTEQLFDLIRRGKLSDMTDLESLLMSNPTHYLRDPSDPDSFVNKPNSFGVRPITEAVRIGSEKFVILLLDYGANPYLESQVSASEKELPLVTASRWNYLGLVKLLVKLGGWAGRDLRRSYRATKNPLVREVLEKHQPRAFVWWKRVLG